MGSNPPIHLGGNKALHKHRGTFFGRGHGDAFLCSTLCISGLEHSSSAINTDTWFDLVRFNFHDFQGDCILSNICEILNIQPHTCSTNPTSAADLLCHYYTVVVALTQGGRTVQNCVVLPALLTSTRPHQCSL